MDCKYLDEKQASSYLNIPPASLRNMRWRGEGPYYIKLKRKVLYSLEDLEEWLGSRRVCTDNLGAGE
jgi:hypothetical protein